MTDIINGVISGVIAAVLGVCCSFAVRRKGPILANPHILLTKQDRIRELSEKDKDINALKAEYRQVAVISGCLTLVFAYLAVYSLLTVQLPFYPVWILIGLVIIYAVISSAKSYNQN